MSYFKAEMHQIQFRLGLCPRPLWGAYIVPPDSIAGFKGPISKGKQGRGKERESRGRRRGKERGLLLRSGGANVFPYVSNVNFWPLVALCSGRSEHAKNDVAIFSVISLYFSLNFKLRPKSY